MADDQVLVRVDIISDVVCPWCVIGYKQLEGASKIAGIRINVHWHPFELNPQMAEEGENLREHVAAKYGTTLDDSQRARAQLTELGADLGFVFNYADDMRMVNTFRAHQVLQWAETQGHGHAMQMNLFEAFFGERLDLNDPSVLAERAECIGLSKKEALALLDDKRFAKAVRQREQLWTNQGISSVPAMIFGEQHLVLGAQGVENYCKILQRVGGEVAA